MWSFGGLQLILTSKIYLPSQIPPLKRTCTFTVWSYVSVQISHSVVSNSLQPHGLQHARFLCQLPTPGACWNSCPSSWWFHPTISSSVIPYYSPYLMYTLLFSPYWKWKWKCSSLSLVWLSASQWIVAHQAPLSMRFFRQDTGVGCHFSSRGSFPPRDRTWISCTARRFFTVWATRWESYIQY